MRNCALHTNFIIVVRVAKHSTCEHQQNHQKREDRGHLHLSFLLLLAHCAVLHTSPKNWRCFAFFAFFRIFRECSLKLLMLSTSSRLKRFKVLQQKRKKQCTAKIFQAILAHFSNKLTRKAQTCVNFETKQEQGENGGR